MEKLDDQKILSIIGAELANSTGSSESDIIQANRQLALKTYLGDRGEVAEGRSGVVSTDVADAIEWIMPEVMKAFTQNNEVVTFDATGPRDKRQAEIESRYVYDTIMKDNEGFIAMHEFFKDALMQKNGFFKVFYTNLDQVDKESYTGLTMLELEALQMDPAIEITGLTETVLESGISSFDVNVLRRQFDGKIELECVPPENIRVNRMHNSVSLKNARFIGHCMLKTRSELLEDGFDPEIVKNLKTETSAEVDEDRNYRWAYMGENITPSSNSGDASQDLIEICECYMLIDIDGDGIAERCKITVAGISNPTDILEIDEVDEWPFISSTAILMSHKLFGMSVYDRLKEIQAQKTALLRNVLDNIYLQNNQRTIVMENMVNLDDLLVSRPGGVIRAKQINAVQPYVTPTLSGDAYRMFDYLDQTRAGRVGVSPDGSVADSLMGDRVGSQGVERLMNQKEELVGLMIRVFAETGIKPLCEMVRNLLIKHIDATVDYEFHDEWIKIAPKSWGKRSRTTVRVGTGSGNRKEQAAAVQMILGFQKEIYAAPGQSLVTETQLYNALNDFCKLSGMPSAAAYFLDPNSPEGQQNKQRVEQSNSQQQQMELKERQLLAEAQTKIANAEESKARTAEQNVVLTHANKQLQMQIDQSKATADAEIKALKQQLEEVQALVDDKNKANELEFKYYDSDQRAATERYRIDKTVAAKTGESNGPKSKNAS